MSSRSTHRGKRPHSNNRRKRRRQSRQGVGALILIVVVLIFGALAVRGRFNASHTTPTSNPGVTAQRPVLRVLFIGGSIALGEKDPTNDGYLQRAFQALSKTTDANYQYVDKAIYGANSTQLATLYKGDMSTWLATIKPNIVVISWGLLNDALPNTPMPQFNKYLQREINESLSANAKVFIVTPPVTLATYTKFPKQEQAYTTDEMNLVKQDHQPGVYAFNVFDQMKNYLVQHHQTIAPYVADPNHPNRAGHILAGKLLYEDIFRQFGKKPI